MIVPPARDRFVRWVDEVDGDLDPTGRLRVFVPSIMGAGLLVSVAILVGDLVRRVAPGTRRRQRLVRRRVVALVAPVARAVGADPPTVAFPARLRSRRWYAVISVLSLVAAGYVSVGSWFNYTRTGGYLAGLEWVLATAVAASLVFVGLGAVAGILAVAGPRPPRWVRPIVDHTLLGAPEEP